MPGGGDYSIYMPYCCEHLAPAYVTCVNGFGSYNGTKRLGGSGVVAHKLRVR